MAELSVVAQNNPPQVRFQAYENKSENEYIIASANSFTISCVLPMKQDMMKTVETPWETLAVNAMIKPEIKIIVWIDLISMSPTSQGTSRIDRLLLNATRRSKTQQAIRAELTITVEMITKASTGFSKSKRENCDSLTTFWRKRNRTIPSFKFRLLDWIMPMTNWIK